MAGIRKINRNGKPLTEIEICSKLPQKLVERLMTFQKEGICFAINKDGRCLLADEMGLGKTIQAIGVAYYYCDEWPLLIIVPSSLKYTWIEELEKWLPDIHPHDINLIVTGSDISQICSAKVTVVSYGLLSVHTSKVLREALTKQAFQVVIVDESHYIRNTKTVACKVVTPLIQQANRRMLLSGTPALARPVELFPQLNSLAPGKFGSWWDYTSRYCNAQTEFIGKKRVRNVKGASNLQELQARLASTLMIRREKKDVLKQLPPKQRQRVLFDLKESQLKKEIVDLFEELRPKIKKADLNKLKAPAHIDETRDPDTEMDGQCENLSILAAIQKLYRLSGDAKIGPVKDYVQLLCDNGQLKFLIFAYHHNMMNGIQQTLWDSKVKFIRIDGDTKPADRLYYVQKFQSDPSVRVAILSILAAGVGLTLTAAKLVIFAEMYWTPGVMIQCEDRAHRIGQTSAVPVHYLVAKGTMDEWVWSAVCKKTAVVTVTLNGQLQKLDAHEGDHYQIDVLSKADVWVPSAEENKNMDITQFFLSQQNKDQPSILEFLSQRGKSPKRKQNIKLHDKFNSSRRSTNDDSFIDLDCASREEVIVLDDDSCDNYDSTVTNNNDDVNEKPASSTEDSATNIDDKNISDLLTTQWHRGLIDSSESARHESKSSSLSTNTVSKNSSPLKKMSGKRKADDHTSKCLKSKSRSLMRDGNKSSHSSKKARVVCVIDDLDHDEHDFNTGTVSTGKMKRRKAWPDLRKGLSRRLDVSRSLDMLAGCDDDDDVFSLKYMSDSDICDNIYSISPVSKADNKEHDCSMWSCSACTYLNHEEMAYCEVCETPEKMKTRSRATKHDLTENSDKCSKANELSPCMALANIRTKLLCSDTCDKEDSEQTNECQDNVISRDTCDNGEVIKTPDKHTDIEQPCSQNLIQAMDHQQSEIHSSVRSTDCISDGSDLSSVSSDHLVISNDDKCSEMIDVGLKIISDGLISKENCLRQPLKIRNSPLRNKDNLPVADCSTKGDLNDAKAIEINLRDDMSSSHAMNSDNNFIRNISHKAHSNEFIDHTNSLTQSGLEYTSPRNKSALNVKETHSNAIREYNGNDDDSPAKAMGCSSPKRQRLTDAEALEVLSAGLLLSPKHRRHSASQESVEACQKWPCDMCGCDNDGSEEDCEGCLAPRPESLLLSQTQPQDEDDTSDSDTIQKRERVVNLDAIPVHESFLYCVSKYTGRVYLFDKDSVALGVNFLPLDIEVGNMDDVPDILLHPANHRLVKQFVLEWNSLNETKKRFVTKHTELFWSPLQAYEALKAGQKPSTQRHTSKDLMRTLAYRKAEEVGGSVRLVHKPSNVVSPQHNDTSVADSSHDDSDMYSGMSRKGVPQVFTEAGVPLCVNCHKPINTTLLKENTIKKASNAWYTRFCSQLCTDAYWLRTHGDYCREQVFAAEHGVCQICSFDAHAFCKQIKSTRDLKRRANLIQSSPYNILKPRQKEVMVKRPLQGQFWHVDHIVPVWEGGGECDIDNLRTLCVLCHQKVTAKQAGQRATARKLGEAAQCRDITAFFKPTT